MIKDIAACYGLDFVKKIERSELVNEEREAEEDANDEDGGWKGSEKVQLLLKWSRLVAAHYGIEVSALKYA